MGEGGYENYFRYYIEHIYFPHGQLRDQIIIIFRKGYSRYMPYIYQSYSYLDHPLLTIAPESAAAASPATSAAARRAEAGVGG